jgi:hypothetical protein
MVRTAEARYFDSDGRRRLDYNIKPYVPVMRKRKHLRSKKPEIQLYRAMRRGVCEIDHQIDAAGAPRGRMTTSSSAGQRLKLR